MEHNRKVKWISVLTGKPQCEKQTIGAQVDGVLKNDRVD